jgi:TPR repeat protein
LHWDSDPEAAKYWYRRAISREGSSAAALSLGRLLYNEKSPEAADWLEKAHAAGEEGAAFWLAACLQETDPERVFDLYNQAIQEGEPLAYYAVGWLLQRKGEKDSARTMYQAGAALGDKRCLLGLFDSWSKDNLLEAEKWFYRYVRAGGLREQLRRRWHRRRSAEAPPPP